MRAACGFMRSGVAAIVIMLMAYVLPPMMHYLNAEIKMSGSEYYASQ